MKVLLWHVHGSWTDAFVRGGHEYLVPVLPGRGPDGRGRARTWEWPASVREVTPWSLAAEAPDVVVLQRPHEAGLLREWSGLVAASDLAAVYLEHNTPPTAAGSRHPLAGQRAVPLVHVTHFNRLMWDSGTAVTRVVEHGVPDPGHRWTGELPRGGVVVNDPVRRGRAVGTDLVLGVAGRIPLDLFGMNAAALDGRPGLGCFEDLPQDELHSLLARRRFYLHPNRWTSLGLSLVEAMLLGMPVVALDTTETSRTLSPGRSPAGTTGPGAGFLSNSPAELLAGARRLLDDPGLAADMGALARELALARHSLDRFLAAWDDVLDDVRRGDLRSDEWTSPEWVQPG